MLEVAEVFPRSVRPGGVRAGYTGAMGGTGGGGGRRGEGIP